MSQVVHHMSCDHTEWIIVNKHPVSPFLLHKCYHRALLSSTNLLSYKWHHHRPVNVQGVELQLDVFGNSISDQSICMCDIVKCVQWSISRFTCKSINLLRHVGQTVVLLLDQQYLCDGVGVTVSDGVCCVEWYSGDWPCCNHDWELLIQSDSMTGLFITNNFTDHGCLTQNWSPGLCTIENWFENPFQF